MATRPTRVAKKRVRLSVPLTRRGIEAARARLAVLEQQLQRQARDDLTSLSEQLRQKSTYTSEDEVNADVEEAREEIWHKRQAHGLS